MKLLLSVIGAHRCHNLARKSLYIWPSIDAASNNQNRSYHSSQQQHKGSLQSLHFQETHTSIWRWINVCQSSSWWMCLINDQAATYNIISAWFHPVNWCVIEIILIEVPLQPNSSVNLLPKLQMLNMRANCLSYKYPHSNTIRPPLTQFIARRGRG